MAYIGKEPQFTQYPSKFFNGDGTAMTISLDYVPPNDAAILVFIDGVRQDTSAYSCSGSSLTFTGNVPSGTNNVQVVHLGLSVDVGTVGDGAITSAKIADGAIVNADINASASIAMSKLATDPTNASNLASGTVPTARLGSGTASSSVFLRGDQSWASAGGDNTPGFHANRSSGQGILDATYTKVAFDSETYDSDSAYDGAGKFTVPAGEGGKYVVYSWCCVSSNQGTTANDINEFHVLLKKNGSNAATVEWDPNGYGNKMVLGFNVTLDLSASDYLEVFVWMDSATGSNCTVLGDAYPRSYFGAYKLIGV